MTTTAAALKPWPKGFVQIGCSFRGEEKREHMEGVVHGHCRDCNREIAFDTFTVQRCRTNWPKLLLRPLCIPCLVQYEHPDVLDDLRGRKTADGP